MQVKMVAKTRDICTCFFCTVPLEGSTHRFIKYPIMHIFQKYLSRIWQVLSHRYLRPQQWVFVQYVQNCLNDELDILFQFLQYWGLQHNWNIHNAFMFNDRHGGKAHVKKLKGILMWNFWILEEVGIISSSVYSSFYGF